MPSVGIVASADRPKKMNRCSPEGTSAWPRNIAAVAKDTGWACGPGFSLWKGPGATWPREGQYGYHHQQFDEGEGGSCQVARRRNGQNVLEAGRLQTESVPERTHST